jgi:hypothetical protein
LFKCFRFRSSERFHLTPPVSSLFTAKHAPPTPRLRRTEKDAKRFAANLTNKTKHIVSLPLFLRGEGWQHTVSIQPRQFPLLKSEPRLAPFSKVGHEMPLKEVQQKHRLSEDELTETFLDEDLCGSVSQTWRVTVFFCSNVFGSEVQNVSISPRLFPRYSPLSTLLLRHGYGGQRKTLKGLQRT